METMIRIIKGDPRSLDCRSLGLGFIGLGAKAFQMIAGANWQFLAPDTKPQNPKSLNLKAQSPNPKS